MHRVAQWWRWLEENRPNQMHNKTKPKITKIGLAKGKRREEKRVPTSAMVELTRRTRTEGKR